ncbi:non-homologous end joining protein Ku [Streptomyces sp. 8N616]|uniref:non-homologous end joining protein Ku n=1 Tax=Streptomyces sp. 8N616 TaxID=3457414 RepID=UPI003FD47B42
MARPVWSGTLTFGLVTLPVSLVTATESHTIRFRQLERGTSDRVRNKRVNERTGKEVPYDKIVKGYDTGDDEYVIVEPDELDEIAPGRSQSIDVDRFVDLEEIDPIYFDTTYFVQPKEKAYSKVYGLLHDALEEVGRAGIATFTMRQKEYLVAVHAEGGVIVMHTLHWADEVRDPHRTLDNLPSGSKESPKELQMATQLIEAMTAEWNPGDYRDRTQERVRELVKAKRAGETVEKGEPAPESTKVVDLMSALQASVDEAQKGRKTGATKKSTRGATRRTGGRKTASRTGGGKASAAKKKASTADDLGRLTKAELYERATEANIPRRSSMNRQELQRAVARASGARRRRRAS